MKLLLLIIIFFLIQSASAITIDNPSFVIDIGDSNVSFPTNQTYDRIQWGNNYLNLSSTSSSINYSSPTTTQFRFVENYNTTGSYFNAISGTAIINDVSKTMLVANNTLYYDVMALTGQHNASIFQVTDNIGEKIFTSTTPLTLWGKITTLTAATLTASSAILTGHIISDGDDEIWFKWGTIHGFYRYTTEKQSAITDGDYTKKISGFPLMAEKTFYYKVVTDGAEGEERSFTLSAVTEIPDFDFDKHLQELKDANFNISAIVELLPKPYEDVMGGIFWGILFGMIFVAMWIRQDDVTIPSLLGIIISVGIFALIPQDYIHVGYALLIVSIAGIIVSIIFKK